MKKILVTMMGSIAVLQLSACSSASQVTSVNDEVSSASSLPIASSSASSILQGSTITETKTYTDAHYHFTFEYPADHKVVDAGTAGLGAALNLAVVPASVAADTPAAITVRIYEKPEWSEKDGWIGEDDDAAKVITHGNDLAQIYKGNDGDAATMKLVRSTFRFVQ